MDDLFEILQQMAQKGRSLIFISHKLHEVMTLSDRITVLRNGRVTGETRPCDTSPRGPGPDDGGPGCEAGAG